MAWAQVQTLNGGETGTTGAALTASFGSNVASGNRIFVFTAHQAQGGTSADVAPTSTPSLTWTRLVQQITTSGADKFYCDIYTAVAGSTGSLQISATNTSTSGDELGWTAGEFSGLDSSAGSGCLDVSASSGNPSSPATTSVSTGTTAATHAANQLGLAVYGDWGANLALTAPTGFTKQAGMSREPTAASAGQGVATKTSANAATEGGTWTYTSTNVLNGAAVLVIKLATAAAVTVSIAYGYGPN